MVTRLLPKQITDKWKVIKYAAQKSMPPDIYVKGFEEEEALNNMLKALLAGIMQCWVIYENKDVYGILLTTIMKDACTQVSNLFIYGLCGFKHIPEEEWNEVGTALRDFAKAKRCKMITAFTHNPRVIEIARDAGFSTSNVLLKLEI